MAIATGVNKKLAYKKETTWNTLATNDATAKYLRRLQSNLNLTKQTYRSNEIRTDFQRADFRHGSRSVEGNIQGELSPATWAPFVEAALRRNMTTGVTTGSVSLASTVSGSNITVSGVNMLTTGIRVGDIVRLTGFSADNNGRNLMVTAVTATDFTGFFLDGTTPIADISAAARTAAVHGKRTFVPTSGHTDPSFTIEHWYPDVTVSERFTGCKVSTLDINLPAAGMAEVDVAFMGANMASAASQHFASAGAATTTGTLAAVNGALLVNGTKYATVTGLQFQINGNMTSGEVVGSTTTPDIFEGSVDVSGQFTCYFENDTFLNMFANETEAVLSVVMTASNAKDADFVAFTLPRIKLGGNQKDDGEKGLIQTIPFTALYQTVSGNEKEQSTIVYQDSAY